MLETRSRTLQTQETQKQEHAKLQTARRFRETQLLIRFGLGPWQALMGLKSNNLIKAEAFCADR